MKKSSSLKKLNNKSLFKTRFQTLKKRVNWWTPLWQGLVHDENSKHRKAMGASVWLFLYLLTYTNRQTGIVRRTISNIHGETGLPLRTIHRYLKRLTENSYITILESKPNLTILIEKWKEFKNPK